MTRNLSTVIGNGIVAQVPTEVFSLLFPFPTKSIFFYTYRYKHNPSVVEIKIHNLF